MRWLCLLLALTTAARADESLRYVINWPSGLSLGEAQLESRAVSSGKDAPSRMEYRFFLDASVPGFTVADRLRSLVSDRLCSIEFEKKTQHGLRKASEKVTFKPDAGVATRETVGGGKSDIPISGCAHDALAYLYHLRSELAAGRLPAAQTILFGAPYQISLHFAGTEEIRVNDQRITADRLEARLKGPSSQSKFELYFSHEAARRLLKVRVPLPLGSFSMDLVD